MNGGYSQAVGQALRSALMKGQTAQLKVNGSSMRPLMRPGDLIMLEGVAAADLKRGDILAFSVSEQINTHRFLGFRGALLHTRGDNTLFSDPLVQPEAVLGRVASLRRGHRFIEFRVEWNAAINRWLGWIGAAECWTTRWLARPSGEPRESLPFKAIGRILSLAHFCLYGMITALLRSQPIRGNYATKK